MHFRKSHAIALLVLALVLLGAQAVIWNRAGHSATETDNINHIVQHPPTALPGIVGMCLLVIDGILLSIPRHRPHP